jgi:hypothetical protein
MKPTLEHLQVWQDLSGACINAGRAKGGVWSVKAFGVCPIQHKWIEELGQGATLELAIQDLLNKMSEVLSTAPIPRIANQ